MAIRMGAIPLAILESQYRLDQLNAAYGEALDNADYDSWIGLFTEDCFYRVVARENYDQDLPLSIIALEGHGMMKDRVYGITNTLFHAPYYQRHVIGAARILSDDGRNLRATANYAVFRTKPGSVSEVYNVGRYVDRLLHTPQGLKLQERICVFDSELILNSLIYPV